MSILLTIPVATTHLNIPFSLAENPTQPALSYSNVPVFGLVTSMSDIAPRIGRRNPSRSSLASPPGSSFVIRRTGVNASKIRALLLHFSKIMRPDSVHHSFEHPFETDV